MSTSATTARSAGFALLSRINRWLVAAAVAIAGFLSLLAAHAFHGRTLSTKAAANAAASSGAASSSATSPGAGLSQASQPPAAASTQAAPAPVVSGGS